MLELSNKNFICPKPILNKNKIYISDLETKKIHDSKLFRGKIKKIYLLMIVIQ